MGKDRFKELQAKIHTHENSIETTTILHIDESHLHDFFYQIDLLRNILKQITELIHRIQHFRTIILTSKFDDKTNADSKKLKNIIKKIRYDLKIKIEDMKQTQLPILNKKTRTILVIQNLHINMLKNDFINAMKLHNEAMINYHEQCRQYIIQRFQINQNDNEIDELFHHQDSLVSVIEIINEKQENKYSFDDFKIYYQDIIQMETIMKELVELFLYSSLHISTSENYLNDSIEYNVMNRLIEY